jgi:uncharacterized phiE125 gp8 family phage protein
MAWSLVTGPTTEPLTVGDVKAQARIDHVDDDDWIEQFVIPAVRERGEIATNRAFTTQTWKDVRDTFPCWEWELPKPPLQAVVSITYVDTAGATQTLTANTDYIVEIPAGPRAARGRVTPAYGLYWPATRGQIAAVTLQFRCGYGSDPASVPPLLKMAMLQDAATLYKNREAILADPGITSAIELPGFARGIYRKFRSYART